MAFYSDSRGSKIDDNKSEIWYHGSPYELKDIKVNSSITRNKALAIAFSHKPSQLSVNDEGEIVHDGVLAGYLYEVLDVSSNDIYIHEACKEEDPWEWLIKKEMSLKLIDKTSI